MDKLISYVERIAAAQNPIEERALVKEGTEYYTTPLIPSPKKILQIGQSSAMLCG